MIDGFFKLPNKRTVDGVTKVFEARGISTEDNIAGILARRVRKGVLRSAKGPNGWVYWID